MQVKEKCRRRLIHRGEKGRVRGESHPNARLTDHEIELLRTMHAELGYGYRRLAKMFEITRGYARKLVKFERRP